MKAALVAGPGDPPRYTDVAEPDAGEGQLVAEVCAASLKNIDRSLADGGHYGSAQLQWPLVPGVDGVVRLPDGRRGYTGVLGRHGLMAERTVVDPRRVMPIPDELDAAVAAALPNPALSAWFALAHAGRIQPGQSVLVLGATGITGGCVVQLAAHRFGAGRVVAVGRNTERLATLAAQGADVTVALGDEPAFTERIAALHTEQPFDVVVDFCWGRPAEQVLGVLGNEDLAAEYHRTRYVEVGAMAGPSAAIPAEVLRSAGVELVGQGGGSIPAELFAQVPTEIMPALFAMVADGTLVLPVRTAPLADVAAEWARRDSGERVVFVP